MSPKIMLAAVSLVLLQACATTFPDPEKIAAVRAMKPCESYGSPSKEMTEEAVRDCVEKYGFAIQREYQSWLRGDSNLKGSLILNIEANEQGEILSVSVGDKTDISLDFAKRIAVLFHTYVVLPPSLGGWKDRYTLNFFPE